MYCDYFGLKQPPFKITPDTSLFYPGCNRGAVLEALVYAVLNGEGIVKVVGEVGSGKTMLCRMLEKELPDNVEIVYLANPSLSPENILHAIAFELKLPVEKNASRLQIMNELNEYLLKRHSQNRQVVVFVEEAQGMPIATLEEIRLLSNLETQQNKLLQIVLFGQPELDEMIARPEIRQLKERITYSFQLIPFEINDIREYLNSRLRACGYRAGEMFETAAMKEMRRFSKGLVRRINILADKSLLAAYAENSHVVNQDHVRTAARDSEFVPRWRYQKSLPLVAVAALVLSVIMIYAFVTGVEVPVSEAGLAGASPVTGPAHEQGSDMDKSASPVNATAVTGTQGGSRALDTETVAAGSEAAVDAGGDEKKIRAQAAGKHQDRVGLKDMLNRRDPRVSTNLDEDELDELQQQLERLPPEVALLHKSSPAGDSCRVCWSMIYRPLQLPESL